MVLLGCQEENQNLTLKRFENIFTEIFPLIMQNYVATKVVAKDTIEDWQISEGSITEGAILKGISHKNIVQVCKIC